MWIARDMNNDLYLYECKPTRMKDSFFIINNTLGDALVLDDRLFPEVTFENSPQEVELKIINNENK